MREEVIYAVYKGEDMLCMGTVIECAEILKVKPDTIRFYSYPCYERKLQKRKKSINPRIAIRLDDEDDE